MSGDEVPIRFYCGLCLYSTEVDNAFIFHIGNEHRKELGYWCRDCEAFVKSPVELVAHIRNSCTKLKTCTFKCGVEKWSKCDFSTQETRKFREHFKVLHKGVHLLPCKECKKLFTNISLLMLHVQRRCIEEVDTSDETPIDDKSSNKKAKKSRKKSIAVRAKVGMKLNRGAVKSKMPSLKTKKASRSPSEEGKKILRCRNCATVKEDNAILPNKISLRNNRRQLVTSNDKRSKRDVCFYCDQCSYYTKLEKAFIMHFGKEHGKESHYWCRKCGDVVDSPPELVAHVRESCTEVKKFTFRCGVQECDFLTKDTYTFRDHIKIHHKRVHLIPCKNCNKLFTNMSCLILHMQKQCIIKAKHSKGTPKILPLKKDSGRGKALNGQKCGNEQEVADGISPNKISSSKSDIRFHCGLCPYNTKTDKAFILHYNKEHKRESEYWCRECGDVVESPTELAAHIKERCTKVKSFTFRCGVENCTFSSEDTYKFRRHIKMRHAGMHLFPCKECNKLYTILSCLILHMQRECMKKRRLSREIALVDNGEEVKRNAAKTKKAAPKKKAPKGRKRPKEICEATGVTLKESPQKKRRI